ncbi:hypothetical protein AJ78_01797 [Emergomyces pasteurianus Ep9510]|uniref:SigF-like NTF2-like domain-containing protein n=1 Tax=Emergomyces pasteurianus Ep9510 TaxID=1447872 RepID=A0A1J9PNX9_9EURO|nr:hypothetical protein AJ78_01797 [Emergomyces pasteurianus Ep9510]
MEDPVREIPHVIHLLTQSLPSVQEQTIERFFTPSASFTHPLCRTGSFNGSRWFIIQIYRFYKIMSPRIDLNVHSVAFDKSNHTLYVTLSQIFRLFIIPFYQANVRVTVVLTLTPSTIPHPQASEASYSLSSSCLSASSGPRPSDTPERSTSGNFSHSHSHTEPQSQQSNTTTLYYISAQEDLYQISEVVKFVLPFGIGVILALAWHSFSTAFCVCAAWVLWPIVWAEEKELLPLKGGWRIRKGFEKKVVNNRKGE